MEETQNPQTGPEQKNPASLETKAIDVPDIFKTDFDNLDHALGELEKQGNLTAKTVLQRNIVWYRRAACELHARREYALQKRNLIERAGEPKTDKEKQEFLERFKEESREMQRVLADAGAPQKSLQEILNAYIDRTEKQLRDVKERIAHEIVVAKTVAFYDRSRGRYIRLRDQIPQKTQLHLQTALPPEAHQQEREATMEKQYQDIMHTLEERSMLSSIQSMRETISTFGSQGLRQFMKEHFINAIEKYNQVVKGKEINPWQGPLPPVPDAMSAEEWWVEENWNRFATDPNFPKKKEYQQILEWLQQFERRIDDAQNRMNGLLNYGDPDVAQMDLLHRRFAQTLEKDEEARREEESLQTWMKAAKKTSNAEKGIVLVEERIQGIQAARGRRSVELGKLIGQMESAVKSAHEKHPGDRAIERSARDMEEIVVAFKAKRSNQEIIDRTKTAARHLPETNTESLLLTGEMLAEVQNQLSMLNSGRDFVKGTGNLQKLTGDRELVHKELEEVLPDILFTKQRFAIELAGWEHIRTGYSSKERPRGALVPRALSPGSLLEDHRQAAHSHAQEIRSFAGTLGDAGARERFADFLTNNVIETWAKIRGTFQPWWRFTEKPEDMVSAMNRLKEFANPLEEDNVMLENMMSSAPLESLSMARASLSEQEEEELQRLCAQPGDRLTPTQLSALLKSSDEKGKLRLWARLEGQISHDESAFKKNFGGWLADMRKIASAHGERLMQADQGFPEWLFYLLLSIGAGGTYLILRRRPILGVAPRFVERGLRRMVGIRTKAEKQTSAIAEAESRAARAEESAAQAKSHASSAEARALSKEEELIAAKQRMIKFERDSGKMVRILEHQNEDGALELFGEREKVGLRRLRQNRKEMENIAENIEGLEKAPRTEAGDALLKTKRQSLAQLQKTDEALRVELTGKLTAKGTLPEDMAKALIEAHNEPHLPAKWRILEKAGYKDPQIRLVMKSGMAGDVEKAFERWENVLSLVQKDAKLLAWVESHADDVNVLAQVLEEVNAARGPQAAVEVLQVSAKVNDAAKISSFAKFAQLARLRNALPLAASVAGVVFSFYEMSQTVDLISTTPEGELKELYKNRLPVLGAEVIVGGVGIASAIATATEATVLGVSGTTVGLATLPVAVIMGGVYGANSYAEDATRSAKDWSREHNHMDLMERYVTDSFSLSQDAKRFAFSIVTVGTGFDENDLDKTDNGRREEMLRALMLQTTHVAVPQTSDGTITPDVQTRAKDQASQYINAKIEYFREMTNGTFDLRKQEKKRLSFSQLMQNAEAYAKAKVTDGRKPVALDQVQKLVEKGEQERLSALFQRVRPFLDYAARSNDPGEKRRVLDLAHHQIGEGLLNELQYDIQSIQFGIHQAPSSILIPKDNPRDIKGALEARLQEVRTALFPKRSNREDLPRGFRPKGDIRSIFEIGALEIVEMQETSLSSRLLPRLGSIDLPSLGKEWEERQLAYREKHFTQDAQDVLRELRRTLRERLY
ncbi:hypothetical protein HY285_04450 [Candidatus Peregrinibacteria bacterium]|nr:hypothetical protein [Candidatus Peregrinibacteria bacterium]MBI3816764.1 hypothetical protein [Candidatus Peregrinibacteria bacterium]